MKQKSSQTTYLKDYTPPPFLVDKVDLEIDLGEDSSTVKSRLCFRSNPDFKDENSTLVLDGKNMKLQKIHLDNMQVHPNQYSVDESHLTITNVPKKFELKTEVRIKPQNNTELEGLYKSGEILGVRLNTYHNLFFFISLVKQARKAIIEKRYQKFKTGFLKKFNSQ